MPKEYLRDEETLTPAQVLAMPQPKGVDPQSVAFDLATKAFELIGSPVLTVTAQLDIARPESVWAFQDFQNALLMAYNEGRRSALPSNSLTVNRDLWVAAMSAVDEGLSETKRTMATEKKQKLYEAAYELMVQE